MSLSASVAHDPPSFHYKCRIPQRFPALHLRSQVTRSRAPELITEIRPKSASRVKEEGKQTHIHVTQRSARTERERLLPAIKKPVCPTPKKAPNDSQNKTAKLNITASVKQKQIHKMLLSAKNAPNLPDQDTIKKREEHELLRDDLSDAAQILYDVKDLRDNIHDGEPVNCQSENIIKLKINCQGKYIQFEKMKNELDERQQAIIELYASLRDTHQKLEAAGCKMKSLPTDDLRIMNVAKMTPDQLLQLCTEIKQRDGNRTVCRNIPTMDINKLNNLPTKLIAVCEQTLAKRKEIINWFDTLRTQEKGCSQSTLTKKINEFNAENEMLGCSLQNIKSELHSELKEILDFFRKRDSETMTFQLRIEELTYELSELHSQNSDLKKQVHNLEQLKSQNNKNRIEQLEKALQEEKSRRMSLRDRLSRTEGQVKIDADHVSVLEAALDEARLQCRTLERTIQQLHEQNRRLQDDFDKELNKLNESIKENTKNLEEIADNRLTLQSEKDELEKRFEELSERYNDSLDSLKQELNESVAKVTETENKFNETVNLKNELESKVDSLMIQLFETESTCKNLNDQLQTETNKNSSNANEILILNRKLEQLNKNIEEYKSQILQKSNTIKEMMKTQEETNITATNRRSEIESKNNYIVELEDKLSTMEKQSKESNQKIKSYEEQLLSLKKHIMQMQERFDEMDDVNDLRDMISRQNKKLNELTRQNEEYRDEFEKKRIDIEHHIEIIDKQNLVLNDRNETITTLSEKLEHKTNIIESLRCDIETAVYNQHQQLSEKNEEILSLIKNLDARKSQITQLEKIILTLEDQSQLQKRKDQEKINELEKKIVQTESYSTNIKNGIEMPTDNLDYLIKILENELGTPFEPSPHHTHNTNRNKVSNGGSQTQYNERTKATYEEGNKKVPTKIVMGNFVKKTYIQNNGDQLKRSSLEDKKAIMDVAKRSISESRNNINDSYDFNTINSTIHCKEKYLTKSTKYPNHIGDEKVYKMFKFAGHKL